MTSESAWNSIGRAVSALNQAGSATTRTHIQKLLFFAGIWEEPQVYPFEFVLHLHGPYSFDLDREIMSMEAFGKVTSVPDPAGYGATYSTEIVDTGGEFQRLADWLGPKSSRQLEALATSELLKRRGSSDVVAEVVTIKPHLSAKEVEQAITEVAEHRRP